MARAKFKMTGFARFFIFLIILLPLAYMGASYYHGEDGIQNLKNLFTKGEISDGSGNTSSSNDIAPPPVNKSTSSSTNNETERIKSLLKENEDLRRQLREKEEELKKYKSSAE